MLSIEEAPTNECEFLAMMEVVDSYLRENDFPPHTRPIRGWFEISRALKLELRMFPGMSRKPKEGVYTGDDLTIRIFDWFDERYREKLALKPGPGRVALIIRGDHWEARLPKVWGTVKFFISGTRKTSDQVEALRQKKVPDFNILDSIPNFPEGLAKSLEVNELHQILGDFMNAYEAMAAIEKIKDIPMVRELQSDIDSSVNHLLSSPPHYGMSKWSSLQATEKCLKAFLASHAVEFPRKHDLFKLAKLSRYHGLRDLPHSALSEIQCSAGVRYGDELVNKGEAHKAHVLSVTLCGLIAQKINILTKNSS